MLFGTSRINDIGHLEIGGCDTVDLAKKFGTPLYIMDETYIREACRLYKNTLNMLHPDGEVIYAGKAFLTMGMCNIIEQEGLSLDVVSGGELYTAIRAGFPTKRIYFHGNNKSYDELKMAVEHAVGRIVVDNFLELELLRDIAKKQSRRINIYLRITPGIEAHTHEFIKTGQIDSKFGFGLENGLAQMAVETVLSIKGLNLAGFHCHIGSQIFESAPFNATAEVMMSFAKDLREKYGFQTKELDFGGGFGIRYTEDDKPISVKEHLTTLVETVKRYSKEYKITIPKILIEPGRAIVGEAGTTVYTVGSIKNIPGIRTYVSVDGGMGDNIRTALYGAKYSSMLANKANREPQETVSVAGKCCESGDMLIWDAVLPKVSPGDLLAIFCTGAYNYTMSSNYNRLGRPPVVFVKDGLANLMVKRETYEDMLRQETFIPRNNSISV